MHDIRLSLVLLTCMSCFMVSNGDQTVSYFSWFPTTEHKTITFIPSMDYERASQMCRKMQGMLLTFNWHEIMTINNDLQLLYGPNEYWIGIAKEYGVIRWADGTYFYPSAGFNISFMNEQNQERTCGAVQVMSGYNNYMIQMQNCNLSKKAICESWKTIGVFGILSITSLVLSIVCLCLLVFVVVRSFLANKSTRSHSYVMNTSGRAGASDAT